jgi:DNA repair protein RadC
MAERLHQLGFNDQFEMRSPLDVTPTSFQGLSFPRRQIEELGRFVREVQEPTWATSPQAAAQYLLTKIYTPFDQFDQEELWVLLLNSKNRITHDALVYRGTISTMYVRIAEIFKPAVKVNAAGLILSHCHPSTDPEPSPEDLHVTRQVQEAARLLNISFEDHIIVGGDRWVSLRERGFGFDLS